MPVYNGGMELASNLVWAGVSLALLAGTWRAARTSRLRIGNVPAFALVALVCMLLLPVLSVSDDVMEARQATLPASAQTWHMASQDAASAVEIAPSVFVGLLLLALALFAVHGRPETRPRRRSRFSEWMTRTHSLRPPPALAA